MYLVEQIKNEHGLVWAAALIFIGAMCSAWIFDMPLLGLVPIVLVIAALIVRDLSILYFLLFLTLPFTTEFDIFQGMVLDIPTEPIMMILLVISVLWLLMNKKPWAHIILHPITLLLFFHLAWMILCAIVSVDKIVSFKFVLAKFWFIAAFYLGSWFFLRKGKHLKTVIWCLYIPLLFTALWVLIQHAFLGFTFDSINKAVQPFYRNHVDYASLLVLSYPLIWTLFRWYPRMSWQWWLIGLGLLILPVAIYFSYTRAAIGILLLYPVIYLILRWKMVKWVLLIVLISVIAGLTYFIDDKEYISLAPNYEKTIYHDEFGNLLEATYNMEDLSTMERLYRWIAGGHMLMDRPWMGTGPGTFYPTYKKYTVSSFQTYTSDNPEHSGVHNYYLMTATDQGIIGLVIWLIFIAAVLIFTEHIYHQEYRSQAAKWLIAGMFCMITGVLVINTINDMIENLKVGTLFFFGIAVIAMLGRYYPLAPPIKDKP